MTEDIGKGLNVSNLKPEADGKIRMPVLYRLEGTEDVDGKDLLKFEMHRAGTITNTDLLTVDEHGIICWARVNLDGELVKFNPPQTMIAAPSEKRRRVGLRWPGWRPEGATALRRLGRREKSMCRRENFKRSAFTASKRRPTG
jgi:hypothetical protein